MDEGAGTITVCGEVKTTITVCGEVKTTSLDCIVQSPFGIIFTTSDCTGIYIIALGRVYYAWLCGLIESASCDIFIPILCLYDQLAIQRIITLCPLLWC